MGKTNHPFGASGGATSPAKLQAYARGGFGPRGSKNRKHKKKKQARVLSPQSVSSKALLPVYSERQRN